MQPVPMSEVKLEIQADSLMALPKAAEYRAESGQATATVRREGKTIIVRATCDSLQRMCELYERNAAVYQEKYDNLVALVEEEREQRYNPVRTFFVGLAIGLVLCFLIVIFIKLKLKIMSVYLVLLII